MSDFRQAPGLRGLGSALAKLTRPVYKRRGFARADVLARWSAIVGEALAATSCPEKLSFPSGSGAGATLQVRVASGFALELQHLAPLVVERINTYYGYQAVARLKLVQGPLPRRTVTRQRAVRPLDPSDEATLARQIAGQPDAEVRAALQALGRSLRGSTKPQS
jgi:hypothetical protein